MELPLDVDKFDGFLNKRVAKNLSLEFSKIYIAAALHKLFGLNTILIISCLVKKGNVQTDPKEVKHTSIAFNTSTNLIVYRMWCHKNKKIYGCRKTSLPPPPFFGSSQGSNLSYQFKTMEDDSFQHQIVTTIVALHDQVTTI